MSSLIFLALFGIALAQDCNNNNCQLPDCRCFVDSNPPGGLTLAEIPQMVVITMDYSLTVEFQDLYNQLFNVPVTNPNGCALRGSFYIQDTDTVYEAVKAFYDRGFEAGVNSVNGEIPTTATEWIDTIKGPPDVYSMMTYSGNQVTTASTAYWVSRAVKDKLIGVGIAEADILGSRAPQLTPDGNDQFIGIGDNNMLYEASCVTTESLETWPYTYDFGGETAKCNSGNTATELFPGKWQVLLPEFDFKGQKCASPQSCTDVATQQDAFDILYDNFAKHYEGAKTPFVITIDPSWVKEANKLQGTIQFLEYIRAAFGEEVWVVSTIQMLQWMQQPTALADLNNFAPWQC